MSFVPSGIRAKALSSHYNGALKVTWRYVTEKEINPDADIQAGDLRFGVIDGDGNVILKPDYAGIKVLSKDRIYAMKPDGVAVPDPQDPYNRACIFDAEGNYVLKNACLNIRFFANPITGKTFPLGCCERICAPGEESQYFLVDFDGKIVLDRRIAQIFRFGDDPRATDPNTLIAVDYDSKERYLIDINGTVTQESNGSVIVRGK